MKIIITALTCAGFFLIPYLIGKFSSIDSVGGIIAFTAWAAAFLAFYNKFDEYFKLEKDAAALAEKSLELLEKKKLVENLLIDTVNTFTHKDENEYTYLEIKKIIKENQQNDL